MALRASRINSISAKMAAASQRHSLLFADVEACWSIRLTAAPGRISILNAPPRDGGWIAADMQGGWTCCVSQGWYGHMAGKRTWLYAHSLGELPELCWGDCEQRLHPIALAKYGYAKARRIGMTAMVGGKDKTKIRNATPIEFRDALISMVRPLASVRWSCALEADFAT